MKKAIAIASFLCGLAAASPAVKRQEIDIAAYEAAAAKATTVVPPIGDAAPQDAATYDPDVASDVVVNQISTANPEVTPTTAAVVNVKRDAATCTTRTYNGPRVTAPADTPEAFLAYQPFKDAALDAAKPANVPIGYQVVSGYVNLQATAISNNYLTYISSRLTSYDTKTCASVCDGMAGCNSFVIYYERDPLVVPDNTCPANSTSPSATLIKCAFYGQPVTSKQATNSQQFWGTFRIVYAGANAYYKYPETVDGFKPAVSFGNTTINAPAPVINHGYLRTQTFGANVPFDPSLCAASCNAQTAYNAEHGLFNGSACVFFNAFIWYKNGLNGVFSCNYYSINYDASYATNVGQYDSAGNRYTNGNSYGYYLDLDYNTTCPSLLASTTTVTATATVTVAPAKVKRAQSIPASASPSAYYSACSALGFTPTTATSTVTATATATSAPQPNTDVPADLQCPRDDSKTLTLADGKQFKVYCGYDTYTNGWWTVAATSFADCLHQCDLDPNCDSIAYTTGGSCYPAMGTFAIGPFSDFASVVSTNVTNLQIYP